jgi:hypothetical protein
MLIFNTTLHLDDSVHEECLLYLKESYIPRSLSNGLLQEPSLMRIQSLHSDSGISYALQFKVKDKGALNKWIEEAGGKLQQELAAKFGNKVAGFVTLMEEISL